MRFINGLCPPALLYLLYVTIHTGLDLSLGHFGTALVKTVMGIAGVVILDALCSVDLGIVSWAIVATPFLMVAVASSISLGLGIDRATARLMSEGFNQPLSGDNKMKNDTALPVLKDIASPISTASMY
uniref:Uncharacterized protein n=1 Tax=viral metagenome TaxID=1070528 RepID=A0A6C0JLU4_9ZZZZ